MVKTPLIVWMALLACAAVLGTAVPSTARAQLQQPTDPKAREYLAETKPAKPLDTSVLDSDTHAVKRDGKAFTKGRRLLAAADADIFAAADDALVASYMRKLAQTKPGKPKDAKVSDAASITFKRLEKGYAALGRKLAQTKPGKPKDAKVSDAASISFKRLEKGYAVQGRKLAQTKPGKPKDAKVSDAASIFFKRLEKGYAVLGRKLAQTKPGKPKDAKVSDAASISFKRLEKGYAVLG